MSAPDTAAAGRAGTLTDADLVTALGLVWGLLDSGRHEQAWSLARAARLIWPASDEMRVLAAYAQSLAELGSADAAQAELAALGDMGARGRWSRLVQTLRHRLERMGLVRRGRRPAP